VTADTSERLAEAIDELLHLVKAAPDLKAFNVFVELDLTITQVRSVFLLSTHDQALPISEVADHLGVSAATAGRTIDRLVTLGLVDRDEDPDDRRSRRVSLTPTGQDLADTQRRAVHDRIGELTRALPTDLATGLDDALRAALDALPAHLRANSRCAAELDRS